MLTERIDEAFALANDIHQKQKRKRTTIPYLSHLMSVSALVLEYGGDEEQAIAALLHDSLEDGEDPVLISSVIFNMFGERVLKIVKECSDTEVQPKPPWKERKEIYLNHLEKISDDALIVSICDKLHNLGSIVKDFKIIGDEIFERFKGKKEGTIWYYTSLHQKYVLILDKRPSDQLKNAVNEIEALLDWFKL